MPADDTTQRPSDVIRAMVSMFTTGDVSDVSSIVHADYVDHQGQIRGPTGFGSVVQAARAGYTALDVAIEDLIESENRVAVRLRWSGTQSSGEADQRETIDIIRTAEGQAIEHWGGRS